MGRIAGNELDRTQVLRNGRRIEQVTYTDISPELVLVEQCRVRIAGMRAGVGHDAQVLHANWRRRLAHVAQT